MSNIDERIVQMTFENHLFEKNVATSINTLNKLKDAMKFEDATASLGNIEKTIGSVNFTKLEEHLDGLSKRFSAFGIAGMTVIQDLTRSAEQLGMKLYNGTIGQIKSGGWSRATNIDKARFAIEGLKMSWDDLEPSISAAVNGTRFGFDEAATAASQLAASNVQVGEDMDNALKSIANVASQTGAEYSEIGHIYTVIAGNGKLMTEQMQQFSYRGFNAAAAMAEVWNKTEAEVRDMVSKGEVDFKEFSDAMNAFLGEGAQRANKTFEGAFANMKAALSRIGQPFAKAYRDAMIPIFNSVRYMINYINGTRIKKIATLFEDFAQKASHLFVGILGKIDLSWLDAIVDGITWAYNLFDGFMSKLTPLWSKAVEVAEEVTGTTDKVVKTAADIDDMAKRVIRGEFGNGLERQEALAENYEIIQNKVNEMLGCTFRYDVAEQSLTESVEENSDAVGENADAVEKSNELWDKNASLIENAKNIITSWPERIKEAFSSIIDKDAALGKLATMIAGVKSAFEIVGKTVFSVADGLVGPASEVFAHLVNIFLNVGSAIGSFLIALNKILNATGVFTILRVAVEGLGKALSFIAKVTDGAISALTAVLTGSFNLLGDSFANTRKNIKNLWETIKRSDQLHNLHAQFVAIKGSLIKLKKDGIDSIKSAFSKVIGVFDSTRKSVLNLWNSFTHSFKFLKLKTDIDSFKNKLISLKDRGIKLVSDGIKEFGLRLNSTGTIIKDNVLRNFRSLQVYFDPFIEGIKNGVKYIGSFIGKIKEIDIVKTAIKNFSYTFGSLYDLIKNSAPFEIVFKGFKSLGTIFQTAKTNITEFVSETAKRIKNGTFTFPEVSFTGIRESVTKGLEWIKERFKNFKMPEFSIDGIKQSVKNGTDWIKEKFSNFKLPEFSLSGIKDSFNSIVALFSDHVLNPISRKFEEFKLPKFDLSNIEESFDAFITWARDIFANFTLPEIDISGIKKSIFEGLDWIKEKVQNFKLPDINVESIKESFENVINWFVDKFNTTFKNFKLPAFNFEGVRKSFSKGITWVKNKFANFKLPDLGIEKLSSAASSIFDKLREIGINLPTPDFSKLGDAVDKVRKAFSDFGKEITKRINFPKVFKNLKISGTELGKTLSSFGSSVGKKASAGITMLGDSFSNLYESASRGGESIRNFFEGSSESLAIKDKVHGLSEAFKSLFDRLRESEAFQALNDWLVGFGEIFEEYDGNLFALVLDIIDHVKEPILGAISWIGSKLLKFINFIKDPITSAVTNVVSFAIDRVKELVEFITKDRDILGNKNIFNSIMSLIKKVSDIMIKWYSAKALKGLLEFVAGLGSIAKNVGKILKNISRVLKSVSGTIDEFGKGIKRVSKATARELNARALLEIAGAVVVMALAFKLLSTISWDQFEVAAAAIIVITGALSLLLLVAGRGSKSGGGNDAISTLGAGLANLGKSLQKGLKNIGRAALIFSFVYAVKTILDTIKELTDFRWSDAKNGLKIMGAVMLELVASMALLNLTGIGGSFGKNFGMTTMILAFTLAIKVIADSIISLAEVDPKSMSNAKRTIEEILGIIALYSLFNSDSFKFGNEGNIKKGKTKSLGKGKLGVILAMTLAIFVIAEEIKNLSRIKPEKLKEARNALFLVGLAIAAIGLSLGQLSKSFKEAGVGNSALAILGIVAILGGVVNSLAFLTKLDTSALDIVGDSLSKVIVAIASLSAVIAYIGNSGISDDGLLAGGKAALIGAGITALVGFIASLIGLIPGAHEFMQGGAVILEDFAGWIGSFVGGLVGGVLKGITDFVGGDVGSSFDALPDKLNSFIENLDPFLNAISDLTSDGATAFLDIMKVLGEVFVLDVFDTIFEKLTGTSSFTDFGNRLLEFADAITKYSAAVSGKIDESAVATSARAGQMLADLEDSIPNSGGKLATWLGDNTLSGFGSRLNKFANAIVNYSNIVSANPIDEAAVKTSANAGKMLADLENSIPNSGGKLAQWIGDNTLSKFSEGLEPFAKAIIKYSDIVSTNPIDNNAVESSANAGKMLASLERAIPNEGGFLSLIVGDNTLDDFGSRIESFGSSMVAFSDTVSGNIKYGAVTAAQNMAAIFVALENNISDQGGFFDALLFGSNDIESFGNRLEAFATSLVSFTAILAGDNNLSGTNVSVAFDPDAISDMISSIQELVDFANTISGTDYGAVAESLNGVNTLEVVLMDHFQKLANALQESDTDYTTVFEDMGKSIASSLAEGIEKGITASDKQTDMKSVAKAITDGLSDKSVIAEVKNNSKDIGAAIIEGLLGGTEGGDEVSGFTEGVVNAVNTMIDTVSASLRDSGNSMATIGSEWGTNLANGLRGKVSAIKSAAASLGNGAVSTLRTFSSNMTSIGTGWGTNITSGITAARTTVNTAARTLGTSAGQAFNSGYQASTANTTFVPGTTPQGEGKALNELAESGKAMGSTLVDSMGKGIESSVNNELASQVNMMANYANAVLNEAIDTTPVITPVLDMSNIQNASNLMGSYFGNANMMLGDNGASAYVRSLLSDADVISSNNAQVRLNDVTVQDTLNGIRSDIKDLGEAMSHMQMVMNNGALVGQIGNSMDKQLGSIQKFKERWA